MPHPPAAPSLTPTPEGPSDGPAGVVGHPRPQKASLAPCDRFRAAGAPYGSMWCRCGHVDYAHTAAALMPERPAADPAPLSVAAALAVVLDAAREHHTRARGKSARDFYWSPEREAQLAELDAAIKAVQPTSYVLLPVPRELLTRLMAYCPSGPGGWSTKRHASTTLLQRDGHGQVWLTVDTARAGIPDEHLTVIGEGAAQLVALALNFTPTGS